MNFSAIFSPDSKFMTTMSRIGDLILLNVYFLICSLPVLTIGASVTALYTVCFRFDTERETGVTRSFFVAFKENFKQATLMWLVLVVFGVATAVSTYLLYAMPGVMHYGCYLFGLLCILVLIIGGYGFPLMSQFDNTIKQTMKNALLLGIAYLPRTIVVVVMNLLPFALLMTNILLFFNTGFIWAFFYFGAAAYLNAWLLKKVFAPYMTTEKEEETA